MLCVFMLAVVVKSLAASHPDDVEEENATTVSPVPAAAEAMNTLATEGSWRSWQSLRNTVKIPSMKVQEVAFVGYPVTDIDRARQFYEKVLGLEVGGFDQEIEGMPGKFWIEYVVGGTALAISNAWDPVQNGGPSIALEVEDFETAVGRLKEAGVTIVAERIETPYCCFALITDPDGNGITIHKRKDGSISAVSGLN